MAISLTLPQPVRRLSARELTFAAALLGLFVAGLASLAIATGWEESLQHVTSLSLGQVALLLALSLVNYLARALRWHLFVRRLGLPTTLWQDMRHFLGGFAMTVTPGRVGELIRLRWLKRETGWSYSRTLTLPLADRASDLGSMGIVLGLALLFSAASFAGALPVAIIALGAALAITNPRVMEKLAHALWRLIGRWPRIFVRVRRAARSLSAYASPGMMTAALGLGTIGWLAEGYALWLLLGWMGADIGLWMAVAIFAFATLAGGLTGAPGGLGGAEAAMIALLKVQGVPLGIALPATAVIRLTTLWFAIGIGCLIFPAAERRAATASPT
ncbi:MAG: lysylphosphatidylglycerol synthase transmembrane domain-containing protein [Pseudomonadota bacterium]